MRGKINNSMSWMVYYFNWNSNKIDSYNVLNHQESLIKKLKKKSSSKKEFEELLNREMMWRFWSKCEWEVIIEKINSSIFLKPWVGCQEPNNLKITMIKQLDFDWLGFANYHINKQGYKDKAKIDVYDQLRWRWEDFVDYCWYYRHKYQRKNLGGARINEV